MLSALLLFLVQADEPVDFKRDIRPILSNRCFLCHGPDDKRRKSDLRLDSKESAFKKIDGKQAFVPGTPDDSEALRRILSKDSDEHMPPAKSGKQLTPKQIDLLRRWILQGARWSNHWSFSAPEPPPLPEVKARAWVRSPIDAFILARLEREGMQPS